MKLQQRFQYPGKDLEAMSFAVNYHAWILEEIEPFLGDVTAEVGAGSGSFSRLLLTTTIKCLYAFEPSTEMFSLLVQNLQDQGRARVVHGFFDPGFLHELLDSICYINVLEHIQDDLAELLKAREALKPRGRLILFVPALEWLYSDQDRSIGHFRRYTQKELQHLVRSAGFAITASRYFDLAGVLPWFFNFVVLKNSLNSTNVSLYDRVVVPVMRGLENHAPHWKEHPLDRPKVAAAANGSATCPLTKDPTVHVTIGL
jgi:SAM-dependent methyltransferase